MHRYFNVNVPVSVGDFFIMPYKQHTNIELCYGMVLSLTATGLPRVAMWRKEYCNAPYRAKRSVLHKPGNLLKVSADDVPQETLENLEEVFREHS